MPLTDLQDELPQPGEVLASVVLQLTLHLLDPDGVLVAPLHLVDVVRHVRHVTQRLLQQVVASPALVKVLQDVLQAAIDKERFHIKLG